MWRLAIDCKMLTAQKEIKVVLDFFSLQHYVVTHFSNHAKPEKIVSPYPCMQLHHMPLST